MTYTTIQRHIMQLLKAHRCLRDDQIDRLVCAEFDYIKLRYPLHCRRVSRIVGKRAGGVFCELEKGFSCLCLYSPEQQDCDFDLGDDVIVVVSRYDDEKKQVFGRIVTAW